MKESERRTTIKLKVIINNEEAKNVGFLRKLFGKKAIKPSGSGTTSKATSSKKEGESNQKVDSLIDLLTDKDMDVRRKAAEELGEIGDVRAVAPLIKALKDTTDYPVFHKPLQVSCIPVDARVEAALALGKIGGNSATEALQEMSNISTKKGYYRGLTLSEAVTKALLELRVSMILDAGTDVNATDHDGWTLLLWVANLGFTDIAAVLLDHGANVNVKDPYGWSPLYESARSGHTETVALLLDRGAEVNIRDYANRTPLHVAVAMGHEETAALLRQHGGVE